MTLEEFKSTMKADLDRFVQHYEAGHATDPQNWPAQMGEGDWYDQFLIFMGFGE